jgi:hypothetical protein
MPFFLYVAETAASIRAKVVGYAQSAGLLLTNMIAGGVGEQILETVVTTIAGVSAIQAKAIRGFASLDTSFDPGDVDPYDPDNAGLPPTPGFLSDFGSNVFGTDRIVDIEATGSVTFANTGVGAVNQNLTAFSVTFQRDTANTDGSYPTYRNSAPIIAAVGITVTVPIIAESPGAANGAGPGHVTVLVTTLPGVTVTNPAAVVGFDRQGADDYKAACREAASLTSPNGPEDAIRYLAVTARDDGTFGNSTTGNSLGITRVYVSQASSNGIVNVYFAGPAGGAAISGSVAMANQIITKKPGFISVPDAITYTGLAATDVSVPLTYTVKAKVTSVPGGVAGTYTQGAQGVAAPVFAAIEASMSNVYFAGVDIGGFDQTAGAGTLYADEIRSQIAAVWPTTYHTTLSAPGADVALAVGHVAVVGAFTGTVVLT